MSILGVDPSFETVTGVNRLRAEILNRAASNESDTAHRVLSSRERSLYESGEDHRACRVSSKLRLDFCLGSMHVIVLPLASRLFRVRFCIQTYVQHNAPLHFQHWLLRYRKIFEVQSIPCFYGDSITRVNDWATGMGALCPSQHVSYA